MMLDDLICECAEDDIRSSEVVAKASEYIFDGYYYVDVIVDGKDSGDMRRLRRRICKYFEAMVLLDLADANEWGYRYKLTDNSVLDTVGMMKRLVKGVIGLIKYAVKGGAMVFIRIFEGKIIEGSEETGLRLMFANIATDEVKISTKEMMRVMKEIGSKRSFEICVKVEG